MSSSRVLSSLKMAGSGALNAGRHIRFSSLVFVGSAKKNRLKTGKNLMGTLFPAFFDLACFVF